LIILIPGLEIGSINLNTDEIKTNNFIKFNCESRVECCSSLKIPVNSRDIERIETQGFELDQIVESMSPVFFPSKTQSGRTEKTYILKRKPFTGECTFLENDKCKIHEFKPFACRIYPFELNIVNEESIAVSIHANKLCKSIKIVENNTNNLKLLKEIKNLINAELSDRGFTG
jgi:Fe-S-cluster containining protein